METTADLFDEILALPLSLRNQMLFVWKRLREEDHNRPLSVEEAMVATNGNKTKAAIALGVHRTTLYRKLDRRVASRLR